MNIWDFGDVEQKWNGSVYYVPIGDWNSFQYTTLNSSIWVYYVPIGNWNFTKMPGRSMSCLSLLRAYRGLKHWVFETLDGTYLVYYVPIGDWNLTNMPGRSLLCLSLLRAYRGLKLRLNLNPRLYIHRLLRAYRGLKQEYNHQKKESLGSLFITCL